MIDKEQTMPSAAELADEMESLRNIVASLEEENTALRSAAPPVEPAAIATRVTNKVAELTRPPTESELYDIVVTAIRATPPVAGADAA